MKKTCQVCGVGFEGHHTQKYCSHACRDESMRQGVDLTCPQCGKVYQKKPWEIQAGRGKFCSRACYTAARIGKERPSTWRRYEKVCPVCGKTFTVGGRAGSVNQRVCSDECKRVSRYRHGARSNELLPTDAAYIAGFLDGEGSVMLTWRLDTVAMSVVATNTNKGILDWIVEITGVGAVNNHRAEDERVAATFMWKCSSEAAETLLRQLQPYMKVKAEQAALAIETQERLRDPALKADRAWQEEYRQRMKDMNKRGPRATLTAGG